jgi:hypothetical protein
VALAVGVTFLLLFVWLAKPARLERAVANSVAFLDLNQTPLLVAALSLAFNLMTAHGIGKSITRRWMKGGRLPESGRGEPIAWKSLALAAALFGLLLPVALWTSERWLALRGLRLLPFRADPSLWIKLVAVSLATTGLTLGLLLGRGVRQIRLPMLFRRLPAQPVLKDGIVLGAVHEDDGTRSAPDTQRVKRPAWLSVGLRALTGNLFIAGVIGSGKSQVLLQYLRQILAQFSQRPALLAIDPKRTFVRELRKIIETAGLREHLLWIELGGTVKFNPIWRENLLKNSAFTTVANSLRLASINFIGSTGESRFWEQSSFNLLKNVLVFCAAKHGYFTFRELYRAMVQARDEGLAAELVECLAARPWDDEERSNIEMTIDYFRDEFTQLDQKLRTSILATATSFLNEFLEYRIAQILSPPREEITLTSMGDAIRAGELICLNIENDALARSVGTLLKLLYEEAVLERVTRYADEHEQARYAVLVMDEYQDVATSGGGAGLGDDRYLAKARESKAITIAATQSVSSLENAIRSEAATRELLQNFRTRILGNTTDPRTIRLFQEPMGVTEVERRSRSIGESSQDVRPDLLFGGIDARRASVSESVSTHSTNEYPVTAREFARLRTFEAFAQVFDGLETRFEKLFLKPYFLKDMRTAHRKILADLRAAARVSAAAAAVIAGQASSAHAVLFPNVCSVVKASNFRSCTDLSVSGCMCGWPIPRPCAQISYFVPQTFIEVWPDARDSFFSKHPAATQLAVHPAGLPLGIDDEMGGYSFQARAIAVPLAAEVLMPLPCGGTRIDKPCFDLMSEDLGSHWRTGSSDGLQPNFLAWKLSPKACLLKGAAQGAVGGVTPSLGADIGGCSLPIASTYPTFPPSSREACNGWGLLFPRSGVYEGASRATAALMVAARLKSLGTEVARTVPGAPEEVWQMIYPQASTCFREGESPGLLEALRGMREEARLLGKPNGYLFVVWKKVSCCMDIPVALETALALVAIEVACAPIPGGGV